MNALALQSAGEPAPRSIARAAGFFWLMTVVASAFAYAIAGNFYVPSDPAATAANVVGHESLYRLAFTANLIATACYLAATLLVYVLLRPVNRDISLLATFFSLIGCAIGAVSCLLFLAPLGILNNAQASAAFTSGQLQNQAVSFLRLSAQANDIGLVFFGLHVLCVGYLIRRSTFLPRFLGALLALTSLCYLTNSFATFLALPFRSYLMPLVAAGGLIGEGTLTFWLLIAGVNTRRWLEQAATTTECRNSPALALSSIAS
jgi:hypothetical protein